MMGQCEICGRDAEYFTETYDPKRKKNYTIPLCEKHQQLVCILIDCCMKRTRDAE